MSVYEELDKECRKFAKKLAIYMNANLEEALKKGGSKNAQQPALVINDVVIANINSINIQMVASGDYWYWLEHGRKPGKQPPSDALGKKWQTQNKIDARKVIQEIQINYNKKKGLKRIVKQLSFDKAAKQLSFIIARSIGKKGYKPRPFVQQALREADVPGFNKRISDIMSREIKIQITTP